MAKEKRVQRNFRLPAQDNMHLKRIAARKGLTEEALIRLRLAEPIARNRRGLDPLPELPDVVRIDTLGC